MCDFSAFALYLDENRCCTKCIKYSRIAFMVSHRRKNSFASFFGSDVPHQRKKMNLQQECFNATFQIYKPG